MDPCRQHSFAGPGLALDQNGAFCMNKPVNFLFQLMDQCARALKGVLVITGNTKAVSQLLATVLLVLQTSADVGAEDGKLHGLGDELLRSLFDRLDRKVNGAVSRKNDAPRGQVRIFER